VQFFQQFSLTAVVTLLTGLLMLIVHLITEDSPGAVVFVAGMYLSMGAVGIAATQVVPLPRGMLRRLAHLAGGMVAGFGLLVLPDAGAWTLWLTLIGLSLVPAAPGLIGQPTSADARFTYAAIIGICATAGAVISGMVAENAQTVLFGLGMFGIGQATFLAGRLRPALGPAEAEEPRFTETQDMRIPILGSSELLDLSMRIHVTVDGLVRSAQAVQEVAGQQTSGAEEQAEVIQMTNHMMDDFLVQTERITENTREISKTAQESDEISQQGKQAIEQAITGMEQIREQVQTIGGTIVKLAQLTRRIDEIITSVSEIATQSNLLALNASIEAARAGVHGRGFAVVADEVRSLAQQSTTAAGQVRGILAEIQSAVKETISATEAGQNDVDVGVTVTRSADQIMRQLAQNVSTTNEAVRSIYQVIRQQADGLEEIAIHIDRVERITQQSLTNTRMVSTVSNNLNRLADDLQAALQAGQEMSDSPLDYNTTTEVETVRE